MGIFWGGSVPVHVADAIQSIYLRDVIFVLCVCILLHMYEKMAGIRVTKLEKDFFFGFVIYYM